MRKREARRKRQKNHAGDRESWAARRERKRREHVGTAGNRMMIGVGTGNHMTEMGKLLSSVSGNVLETLDGVASATAAISETSRPVPSGFQVPDADRFVRTGSHR